jgi:hypothetical protein
MKYNLELWRQASKGRPVFRGKEHIYTIDNGCKIEYYEDGSLKLYNTREGGDFYRELELDEVFDFYISGFEVASLRMAVRSVTKQLDRRKAFKKQTESNRKAIEYMEATISDLEKRLKFAENDIQRNRQEDTSG